MVRTPAGRGLAALIKLVAEVAGGEGAGVPLRGRPEIPEYDVPLRGR
jgi:hypothetical protein